MIYTVTTLEHTKPKYRKDGSSYESRSMRCVGYAATLKEATTWVTDNVMDINEAGYYPFAVIESVSPGIYMFDMDATWFEWDDAQNAYKQLDKCPKEYEKVIGFGIG